MKSIVAALVIASLSGLARAQTADIMLPAKQAREQIIHHKAFSLSYNPSYVQPSWVSYKISRASVNKEEVKGKYIADPKVSSRSADKKDYKEGGYIMAQYLHYWDVQHIQGAVEESFYMTNITPMKLAYYNHIWLKTEELIRLWSEGIDGLYVVTGAILTDAPFPAIGSNHVNVPKRFYKAVYNPKDKIAIGFIFKNGMSSGKLNSYAVSIDEIEMEAEIDLFPELDDALENKVESNTDFSSWNFELVD